jgi:hypothetical protein
MATDPSDHRQTRKLSTLSHQLGANAAGWRGTRRDYFCLSKAFQRHPGAPEISPSPTGGQVVQTDMVACRRGLPGGGHSCQMTTVLTTVTTGGPSTTPPTAPKCTYRAWSRLLPAPGRRGQTPVAGSHSTPLPVQQGAQGPLDLG